MINKFENEKGRKSSDKFLRFPFKIRSREVRSHLYKPREK